jgi:adenosylcobinamide-GDP ribazoletransferase
VIAGARHQAALLLVAVQFLTRVPVPSLSGYQTQWLAQSARYFPLVGALVGVVNVVIWWLASLAFPPPVAVGIMMAASLLLTGAFHEDGFADTCDGFGGGVSKDRVLEIMKDSRIGAYGAIGLVVMLGLKWVTVAALPDTVLPLLLVCAHMVSRWCATALIWTLRYARTGDDAKSAPLAGTLTTGAWLASGALGGVAVACIALLGHFSWDPLMTRALFAAAASVAATTAAAASYCHQRLGGYTGDFLGAVQQATELVFLLSGLAVLGHA